MEQHVLLTCALYINSGKMSNKPPVDICWWRATKSCSFFW